jgi:putative hydrolase of the HAD superfamily
MDSIGTIRGVLFDLDHTLTDREKSFRKMAERMRKHYSKDLRPCSSEDLLTAFQRFDGRGYRDRDKFCGDLCTHLPWKNPPKLADLMKFWSDNFPHCAVESDGAKNMLEEFRSRGLRLGVVSNGNGPSQNIKVDILGFRPFLEFVLVSGEVGVNKPDERMYQLALDTIKLPPGQVVFVGDHPLNDVIIPQRLGMSAVWISGIFDWPAGYPLPSFSVQSLAELPTLI